MEILTLLFFVFAILMLGVQIFVILALMKVYDINSNLEKIIVLLTTMAEKNGLDREQMIEIIEAARK